MCTHHALPLLPLGPPISTIMPLMGLLRFTRIYLYAFGFTNFVNVSIEFTEPKEESMYCACKFLHCPRVFVMRIPCAHAHASTLIVALIHQITAPDAFNPGQFFVLFACSTTDMCVWCLRSQIPSLEEAVF